MNISDDKTRLTVNLAGTYTASQIEELMRTLAEARAEMKPAVAATRADISDADEALIDDNPALTIALRTNGGFRLWLRNRGYGWLAYEIDNTTAAGMYNYLSTRVGPAVNLIDQQVGGKH